MLTGDFLTAASAEKYYDRDEYYLESAGYWHGKFAEMINLSPGSTIQKEDFSNILRGYAPSKTPEKIALAQNAGQEDRNAGCDLTFHAPKSVSILAFGDPRIQAAFDKAVQKSLDYTQSHVVTRHKKNGVMSYEKTGNAAFAVFNHRTSRQLDPQLHAHCVMPNITVDKRGRIMSIHNTIYENKKLLIGQYFRNELAGELQKLGYQIDVTDSDKGFFEIKGSMSREVIEDFSKRSDEVKKKVEELRDIRYRDCTEEELKKWAVEHLAADVRKKIVEDLKLQNRKTPRKQLEKQVAKDRDQPDYPERLKQKIEALKVSDEKVYAKWKYSELAVLAAKKSRKRKKNVTIEYIVEQINDTLKTHNKTLDGIVAQAQAEPPPASSATPPRDAILRLIESTTQNEVAFTKETIVKDALKHTMGRYSPDEVLAEFDRLAQIGKISSLRTVIKGRLPEEVIIYTTPELKAIEAENINICRNSKTNIKIDRTATDSFITQTDRHLTLKNGSGFTPGQKNALLQIVGTDCQISAIQGDAGAGKSYTMLYAKQLLEAHGYNVRGLATTGKAADELHNTADIADTATLHKMIQSPQDYKLERGKEVFIVDESSMGGSRIINKLLKLAKEHDAKVVFVGDRKQFTAVEAGRFFVDLQDKTKVDVTIMKDVIRQKTEQTKGIVKAISKKEFTSAISQLRGFSPINIDKSRLKNYRVGQLLSFDRNDPTGVIPGGRPDNGSANVTAVGKHSLSIKYKAHNREIEVEINPKTAHKAYTVHAPDNTYKDSIRTISDRSARLRATAEDYIDCYNSDKDAIVITATNDDRRELNATIRENLVSQGKVSDVGEFTLLEPQNISGFTFASSFKAGQLVKGLPQLKVDNKYEYGEIIGIDRNENRLKIRNAKTNEEFTINPLDYAKKPFSVFTQAPATLGINERITFLKNAQLTDSAGKPVNVRNGQLATITALDMDGNATVKTDNGKEVKFNLNEYNLLTTAYALSSHKSQGMTVDKIIWHADTSKEISTNSFYVAITRCKYDVSVYTDDIDRLQKKVQKKQEKYSTLDDDSEYEQHDNIPTGIDDVETFYLDASREKSAENSYADIFEAGQKYRQQRQTEQKEGERPVNIAENKKKVETESYSNFEMTNVSRPGNDVIPKAYDTGKGVELSAMQGIVFSASEVQLHASIAERSGFSVATVTDVAERLEAGGVKFADAYGKFADGVPAADRINTLAVFVNGIDSKQDLNNGYVQRELHARLDSKVGKSNEFYGYRGKDDGRERTQPALRAVFRGENDGIPKAYDTSKGVPDGVHVRGIALLQLHPADVNSYDKIKKVMAERNIHLRPQEMAWVKNGFDLASSREEAALHGSKCVKIILEMERQIAKNGGRITVAPEKKLSNDPVVRQKELVDMQKRGVSRYLHTGVRERDADGTPVKTGALAQVVQRVKVDKETGAEKMVFYAYGPPKVIKGCDANGNERLYTCFNHVAAQVKETRQVKIPEFNGNDFAGFQEDKGNDVTKALPVIYDKVMRGPPEKDNAGNIAKEGAVVMEQMKDEHGEGILVMGKDGRPAPLMAPKTYPAVYDTYEKAVEAVAANGFMIDDTFRSSRREMEKQPGYEIPPKDVALEREREQKKEKGPDLTDR